MILNTITQSKYGECFMNDDMKKEILDNWFSWKYDIIDCNRSEWTQRDQAIIETIDQILLKELDDRKAND